MSHFFIYKITNKLNNKIYIGKSKEPFRRLAYHFFVAESKNQQLYALHYAIKKYGQENFYCEIIEKCQDEIICFEREKYWILYYKSNNRKIGYNLTEGGEGSSGRPASKKTKLNLSQGQSARIRKPLTFEHKLKIKQARHKQDLTVIISIATKEEIIQLYDTCIFTKKQLAEKFNLKLNTIVKIIRNHKVIEQRKAEFEMVKVIFQLLSNNVKLDDISKKFNLSTRTIYAIKTGRIKKYQTPELLQYIEQLGFNKLT